MATLTLQPDETTGIDTYISQANPTFNYGVASTLVVGQVGNDRHRALIRFDISSIPAGATITSATLRLYCISESTAFDLSYWVSRSLVQWYEGAQNGSAPGGGSDGSTYNLRNANGSVAWAGGAGGAAGSDWVSSPDFTGGSVSITAAAAFYDWDVTADVQGYYASTFTNYGWWFATQSISTDSYKTFASSSHATEAQRPQLIIEYTLPETNMEAALSGAGSVSADIAGTVNIEAALTGSSTLEGTVQQPYEIIANLLGEGSLEAEAHAVGYMSAALTGEGSVSAHLMSPVDIPPAALEGSGSLAAHILGGFDLAADLEGSSQLEAEGTFAGYMSASLSGSSSVYAKGWAYAKNVVHAEVCEPLPLFYITDGSFLNSGQPDLLDLINPKNGFIVSNWNPNVSQYKDGGVFSDSPFSSGRRLVRRTFANAVEIIDLKIRGHNQNNVIYFVRQLFRWQELAADYWTGDYSFLPVYLVSRSARESQIRYAIIHTMSIPELTNPYSQPFFSKDGKATIESITLRIERGDWWDTPPGQSECVAASSVRSWTVAGWQTGGS